MIRERFDALLRESGFNILAISDYHFEPFGYTALWLLSESHFAVHTFPEEGKAYIEISSCNLAFYERFIELIKELV